MTSSAIASTLLESIKSRRARTSVVGLGYVGLPLAVEFARAGFKTTGIDLDVEKVRSVNDGRSYIGDVPSGDVQALRGEDLLRASNDFDVLNDVDTVNICVPTPLRKTKDPDLSFIVSAVEQISKRLRPGMLVILESTTYPGTTDELVVPILERSGLKAGKDFFVAFSPERIDPGNERFHTRDVPKVVGGLTNDCTALACALYEAAIEKVVPVTSPRVAEMVKLLENTFRAVNIGLVNEIALMCDKLQIDVWEVVDAAKTKPFGFMPFYPGPGLGGHCIPIDPFYLSWKAKQNGFEPRFIELAGHVNSSMPHAVIDKITMALNLQRKPLNGSHVLIAGIAYKRDIDDIRESPALDVMTLLHERGARVSYVDPYVPVLHAQAWPGGFELHSVSTDGLARLSVDCVAILTDHKAFDYDELAASAPLVVDTRNAIKRPYPHVFRLGAPVRTETPKNAAPDVLVGHVA
jgi:UDP-N-acetyl-D-glucosamine dehydrogenase